MKQHEGLRYNEGKLRYTLVHPFAHKQMVEVLEMGAQKYGTNNWEKGMSWTSVIQSLERHLAALKEGKDIDPESQKLHVAHIQCNAHILTAYYQIYPQGDDRPRRFNNYRIGYDIDGVLADFGPHFLNFLNIQDKSDPIYWNDHRFTDNLHKVCSDESFWLSIPTQERCDALLYEPTVYISTRNCPEQFTQQWLQTNGFPKASLMHLGHGSSKVDKCREFQLDYFVDDCYDNFCDLQNNGIKCFLYSRSHNLRYDVGQWRVNSIQEMNKKLS